MKLKEACRIAKECGLITIGEAVDNVDGHCLSLFVYENISTELEEMYHDSLWTDLGLDREDSIEVVLEDE